MERKVRVISVRNDTIRPAGPKGAGKMAAAAYQFKFKSQDEPGQPQVVISRKNWHSIRNHF